MDPYLLPGDPLTLHFTSHRDGSFDVFEAHRPERGAPFGMIAKRTDISTAATDETGMYLFPAADRGYHAHTSSIDGSPELWELAVTPGALARERPLTELAGRGPIYYDPWPSPDDLELTFTADPSNQTRIYRATRSDRSAPWSNPVIFAGAAGASGATLTSDRLTLVYAEPAAAGTGYDLFYATRASVMEPFPSGQPIIGVNTTVSEYEPSIREDGCELFFSRAAGPSDSDIYSVEVPP